MVALATPEDAAAFGYSLPAGTADALLARASARVRGYTRQHLSRVEDDVVTLPARYGRVRLPQRPADKPTRVEINGVVFAEGTNWQWDAVTQSIVNVSAALPIGNLPEGFAPLASNVTVTYSHGYVTLPDELREIVCAVASRLASGSGGMEQGIRSEQTGDVQITYASDALASASSLLPGEKAALDVYLGRLRTLSMELGA